MSPWPDSSGRRSPEASGDLIARLRAGQQEPYAKHHGFLCSRFLSRECALAAGVADAGAVAMSRTAEDARKRARDIRDEALAKHAERDRASLLAVRDELAALKTMVAGQQEQLARLTGMIAELTAGFAPNHAQSSANPSTPRPLSARKRAALERIRELREQDLSFSRICDIFQGEGFPTLSGQGHWSKGTLWNLWKNHAHQLPAKDLGRVLE